MTDGPLIVQSDKTLLLEVDHPDAEDARRAIAPFAELERAPEHVHTYRLTPLGLWNARAAGHDAEQVVNALLTHSRYAVPQRPARRRRRHDGPLRPAHPGEGRRRTASTLRTTDRPVLEEVLRHKRIQPLLGDAHRRPRPSLVHPSERGHLKQELLKVGWPAEDLAGYVDGEAHPIDLDTPDWSLRPYQQQAVDGFWHGGSGVVVLPCGAGKTLVGAGAMAGGHATTLILVTNTVSARQWSDELLQAHVADRGRDRRVLRRQRKEIRPVTIATYQVLTTKRKGVYPHLDLLDARDWGLIVYDEVHLLPAPIFRMTADLQARRRLGLTATLVREDGREGDVFSPDRARSGTTRRGRTSRRRATSLRPTASRCGSRCPTASGWPTRCREPDERYRLASCTDAKDRGRAAARRAAPRRADPGHRAVPRPARRALAERLDAPIITGETTVAGAAEAVRGVPRRRDPAARRQQGGELLDRPARGVASRSRCPGTFGSRQEEAQRLGRVLRPKGDGRTAHFYTVVARDTVDADFAAHRQRFLAEQGYAYRIVDADDLVRPDADAPTPSSPARHPRASAQRASSATRSGDSQSNSQESSRTLVAA